MEALAPHPQAPESLVHDLAAELRSQKFRDALLVGLPPFLLALHIAASLYRVAWIGTAAFLLLGAAALGAVTLALFVRYRASLPPPHVAATLVDERAGAKDHFLTLTTVSPAQSPPALVERLRSEAAAFRRNVELKRDFPYRIKRSFYVSLAVALLAGLLFQLFFSAPALHPVRRLRDVAAKMLDRPPLAALGRELQRLADRVENPTTSLAEERAAINETQKQVAAEEQKEQEEQDRDLLSQASGTLENLERQSGSGQDNDQEKNGGGSVQTNLPQQGRGESKQTQSGGEGKGDPKDAQLTKNMEQGKPAQGAPQNQDRSDKSGAQNGNQADANQPDKSQSKETTAKIEGGLTESGGKGKPSEDLPQGLPPAERFNKPGQEGKEGMKGARYVTVQLPEELAADGKGESTAAKAGRGAKAQSKLPVSNVPLPPHLPDAPAEKQPMPLEYRGIIR